MHNRFVLALMAGLFGAVAPAMAGSHLWRFSEVYSNGAGNIQFIEMYCDTSGENFVSNHSITTANGTFTFPVNLPGSTDEKRVLVATSDFAALPGAPTPDFIIPENFIPLSGGIIRYHPPGNYDNWVYGAGEIPTDGVRSVQFQVSLGGNQADVVFTDQPNNPTNYQGGTGSVNAGCLDNDEDGYGNPGEPGCPNGPLTDCDDSNPSVNPGGVENDGSGTCGDGADNDCDGLTDCDEPVCENSIAACVPTVSEWGVAVLMLTMLCTGSVMLRGRMVA